jgi:hypothetical protein
MAVDTHTPASKTLAERRAEIEREFERGEIDAEYYEDALHFIDAQLQDEATGLPPLDVDYGPRSSHTPAISLWSRARSFLRARLKPMSDFASRSASMRGSRRT